MNKQEALRLQDAVDRVLDERQLLGFIAAFGASQELLNKLASETRDLRTDAYNSVRELIREAEERGVPVEERDVLRVMFEHLGRKSELARDTLELVLVS